MHSSEKNTDFDTERASAILRNQPFVYQIGRSLRKKLRVPFALFLLSCSGSIQVSSFPTTPHADPVFSAKMAFLTLTDGFLLNQMADGQGKGGHLATEMPKERLDSGHPLSQMAFVQTYYPHFLKRMPSIRTNYTHPLSQMPSVPTDSGYFLKRMPSVRTNYTHPLSQMPSVRTDCGHFLKRMPSVRTNYTHLLSQMPSVRTDRGHFLKRMPAVRFASGRLIIKKGLVQRQPILSAPQRGSHTFLDPACQPFHARAPPEFIL